jgi:hypothetical protein
MSDLLTDLSPLVETILPDVSPAGLVTPRGVYAGGGVVDMFGASGAEYEGTRERVVDNEASAGISKLGKKTRLPASEKLVICVFGFSTGR